MTQPRIVTMKHVAEAVGLTKAAVSLALRGHPSIPEKTRARVRAAAGRLGYRANPLVSALMSYHMQSRPKSSGLTLAYVTSHPPDDHWRNYPAYVNFWEGAEERARDLGCGIEEFSLHKLSPRRMLEVLRSRGIYGVLVAPLYANQVSLALNIDEFAVVGLGTSVSEPPSLRVASDNYQLLRLAVARSAALGYKRLGFVVSDEMSTRLEHRMLAGFRQGLLDVGLPEVVRPLMPKPIKGFHAFVERWCRDAKPDLVIFGTYEPKCLTIIPPDVGCVDINVARPDSKITGIYQGLSRIGAISVELLLSRLYYNTRGPCDEPQSYLLHGRWVAGLTTPGPGKIRPEVC